MSEKKSGNILRIFPLFIYKIKVGLNESERNILIKEVYEQETKSKNLSYSTKTSALTGVTQGFEFLYSNKNLKNYLI